MKVTIEVEIPEGSQCENCPFLKLVEYHEMGADESYYECARHDSYLTSRFSIPTKCKECKEELSKN